MSVCADLIPWYAKLPADAKRPETNVLRLLQAL